MFRENEEGRENFIKSLIICCRKEDEISGACSTQGKWEICKNLG